MEKIVDRPFPVPTPVADGPPAGGKLTVGASGSPVTGKIVKAAMVPELETYSCEDPKPSHIPPLKALKEAKLSVWWPRYKKAAEDEISGSSKTVHGTWFPTLPEDT